MKKIFTMTWAMVLFISLTASFLQAKTAYVSDMLLLTFRQGPGTNYSVIKTLRSNTSLTILKEENGFYKVALASGDQGWVDKQFVVFDTPKSRIIEQLTREKTELERQVDQLKTEFKQNKAQWAVQQNEEGEKARELTVELTRVNQEKNQLSLALKKSSTDLTALKEASKDVTGTLEENKTLKAENIALTQTIDQLESESRHMFRTGMIKWFLAGVGVLLLGWIIGQSISSKKRRRGSLLD
ncbi:MAG: TIGR04211 family SH3 domain-containing protein [Desulfobacter sp.]|nr:TIGR04211 family SH3 domain-containing protein [Desulfobacter sp.]